MKRALLIMLGTAASTNPTEMDRSCWEFPSTGTPKASSVNSSFAPWK